MKKFFTCSVVAAVLALLACGPLAQAAPAHTVEADASSVFITVGASAGEEVTLQIQAAGAEQPAFIDQATADAEGASFSAPLPEGEYTYRAYLADAQEYVSGSFRIGTPQTSSPSTSPSTSTSSASSTAPSSQPTAPAPSESDEASPSTGWSSAGLWTAGAALLASLAALAVLTSTKKGERKNG